MQEKINQSGIAYHMCVCIVLECEGVTELNTAHSHNTSMNSEHWSYSLILSNHTVDVCSRKGGQQRPSMNAVRRAFALQGSLDRCAMVGYLKA